MLWVFAVAFQLFFWAFHNYDHTLCFSFCYDHTICFSFWCGAQPSPPSRLRHLWVMGADILTSKTIIGGLPLLDRNCHQSHVCLLPVGSLHWMTGLGRDIKVHRWSITETIYMSYSLSLQTHTHKLITLNPEPLTPQILIPKDLPSPTYCPYSLQPFLTPEPHLYSGLIDLQTHRHPSLREAHLTNIRPLIL